MCLRVSSCRNVSIVILNPCDDDLVCSGILYGECSSAPCESHREAAQGLDINVHVCRVSLDKQFVWIGTEHETLHRAIVIYLNVWIPQITTSAHAFI